MGAAQIGVLGLSECGVPDEVREPAMDDRLRKKLVHPRSSPARETRAGHEGAVGFERIIAQFAFQIGPIRLEVPDL